MSVWHTEVLSPRVRDEVVTYYHVCIQHQRTVVVLTVYLVALLVFQDNY